MGTKQTRIIRSLAIVLLLAALVAHVSKAPVKVDSLDVLLLALIVAATTLSAAHLAFLRDNITQISAFGIQVSLEDREAIEKTAARGPAHEEADDPPEPSASLAPQARRKIELAIADCGLGDIDRESTHTLLARLTDRGWVEPDVARTLEIVLSGRKVPAELRDTFDGAAQAAIGRLREVAFERAVADRFRANRYTISPHGVRGSSRVDFVATRGEITLGVETKLALRNDSEALRGAIRRLGAMDVPPGDRVVVVVPDRSRSVPVESHASASRTPIDIWRLRDIQ